MSLQPRIEPLKRPGGSNVVSLTAQRVAKAKPRSKMYELRDATTSGLALRIQPTGHKAFYFSGRVGGAREGRHVRVKLGNARETVIADARKEARQLRALLDEGVDPTAPGTEGAVLGKLLDAYEADMKRRGVVKRSEVMVSLRSGLRRYRRTPVDSLTLAMLTGIIDDIARAKPGSADYFRKSARAFLGWAHGQGHISANPLAGYRKPRQTRAEALATEDTDYRLKNADDVRRFWVATSCLPPVRRDLLRFILATGLRRAEAAHADYANIHADRITIPAARTNMGRAHEVPLGKLTRSIVSAQSPHAGTSLLFPGRGGKPISGWTQMITSVREDLRIPIRLHDLRRTFRWHLDRMSIYPDLAEVMMAHRRDDLAERYSSPDALWHARQEVQAKWEAWLMEAIT